MPEIKNPFDTPEQIQARKDQEDPWVMYLIVRESLNMGAGKIGAQCGHAVGMIYGKYIKIIREYSAVFPLEGKEPTPEDADLSNRFYSWSNESYRKVVLKADDKEWEKVKKELNYFIVRDAGLTEIEAGSETVIALWPMKRSQAPKIIKKLQVLK